MVGALVMCRQLLEDVTVVEVLVGGGSLLKMGKWVGRTGSGL